MIKFAGHLNAAGEAHVAKCLTELGLDWDASATCTVISEKPGFMEMAEDGSYEHEISNIQAGKTSYGAYGFIEILPEHVHWVELDD